MDHHENRNSMTCYVNIVPFILLRTLFAIGIANCENFFLVEIISEKELRLDDSALGREHANQSIVTARVEFVWTIHFAILVIYSVFVSVFFLYCFVRDRRHTVVKIVIHFCYRLIDLIITIWAIMLKHLFRQQCELNWIEWNGVVFVRLGIILVCLSFFNRKHIFRCLQIAIDIRNEMSKQKSS